VNERIRELALQAGFMEAWFSESGDDCEREITKFAELIVRECIDRVRAQYIPVRDQLDRTEREQGIVECGVNSVIALEELVQESTDKWYKENILEDEE
jgi:hypothetical protein